MAPVLSYACKTVAVFYSCSDSVGEYSLCVTGTGWLTRLPRPSLLEQEEYTYYVGSGEVKNYLRNRFLYSDLSVSFALTNHLW